METNTLALEYRCSLPQNAYTMALLEVLDALDMSVLIVDDDTRICYLNQNYCVNYSDSWKKANIQPEEILGTVLVNRPKASSLESVEKIRQALQSDSSVIRHFYSEEDTHFLGMADIIRIKTEGFSGAAIIQQEQHKISALSSEVHYYKKLYEKMNAELVSKENLPPRFQQVTGSSARFVQILKLAAQVAPTHSSVCILGESGTGKEVLAEAIHYSSKRAEGPFVRVNCAAIPESLMESELFGYEKGAFTGASSSGKPGKFELANHGTLFLDEIGEMPLSMQVKLLRALQEREITRVGGSKPIKLDFRLITATNRDLEQMIAEGTFREDIYYRICIIPLQLPPLRERRSDIPLLAEMFLNSLDLPQYESRHFSGEVMDHLMHYSWPGNIRELKNCVERMAILCLDEEIGMDYLPTAIAKAEKDAGVKAEVFDPDNYNLKDMVDKVEYDAIKTVLSMTNGNKAKAIEILGISKRTFYMKLEKFGLK